MARIFGLPVTDPPGKPRGVGQPDLDRPQLADDLRYQMVNGRVTFEFAQFLDADAAIFADSAQVVAQQIDDHDVLSPILGAAEKIVGTREILLGKNAARTSAFDRPGFDPAALNFDKPLRRSAGNRTISQVKVAREGSRIALPEPLKNRQRRFVRGASKRWAMLTWKQSPAWMYAIARRKAAK